MYKFNTRTLQIFQTLPPQQALHSDCVCWSSQLSEHCLHHVNSDGAFSFTTNIYLWTSNQYLCVPDYEICDCIYFFFIWSTLMFGDIILKGFVNTHLLIDSFEERAHQHRQSHKFEKLRERTGLFSDPAPPLPFSQSQPSEIIYIIIPLLLFYLLIVNHL